MKTNRISAFTLIEMLTVMAIIAVIASLVVAVAGLVNQKAAKSRADGEIHAISAACESYKADNGTYPQNKDTDELDPRKDAVATEKKYKDASQYLYSQLSGDLLPEGAPDGKPEDANKTYFEFKKDNLDIDGEEVKYIQDPFGQSYGYSTAAAQAEAEFRETLRKKPGSSRPSNTPGYNSASFDLWSTGGLTTKGKSTGGDVDQTRWVKNW
jgi:prepilin-type N-terminal cleavage/methylation domain-containing protein